MLSTTEVFLLSKRKGLLQHTVDKEVFASTRLAFYENLLIGQEMSVRWSALMAVRIKRDEFRENVRAFFPQGQRKLSVITSCQY